MKSLADCRPCPLCEGRAVSLDFPYANVWQGNEFRYARCGSCGAVFVDPAPTEEQLSAMYSREAYHDVHYDTAEVAERHRRAVALLERHASGTKKTLLDFGCGSGSFLRAARERGFSCTGIEFHPSAIASAAEATGVDVMSLDDARARGLRFDVIHLGDVFEHLTHPRATIAQLRDLLTPHGWFYLEGPLETNASLVRFVAKSFKLARRAIGKDRPGSNPPTHVTMVDRRAQESFFARLGFRTIHFEIDEDGWPYRVRVKLPPTPGNLLKGAVGDAAVALAHVSARSAAIFGNRFAAIFEDQR